MPDTRYSLLVPRDPEIVMFCAIQIQFSPNKTVSAHSPMGLGGRPRRPSLSHLPMLVNTFTSSPGGQICTGSTSVGVWV